MRRFAVGCEASIGFENGTRFESRVRFTDDDGRPAAVGFAHDADAVFLRLNLPPDLPAVVAGRPDLLRGVRAALFRHRVRTAPALDGLVNVFGRDWLAQAFLCAAAGCGAVRAVAGESPDRLFGALAGALDVLFQALPVERAENAAVFRSAVESLDTGPVLAYPRVRAATATAGTVTVMLELAEVAQ